MAGVRRQTPIVPEGQQQTRSARPATRLAIADWGGGEVSTTVDTVLAPLEAALQPSVAESLDGSGNGYSSIDQAAATNRAQPKLKRKPGRPISYTRNPDEDETLTKQDRRKIYRRVANRESARRTRQKRRDKLKVMQDEVEAAHLESMALQKSLDETEAGRHQLEAALEVCENKLRVVNQDNVRLAAELRAMHAQVDTMTAQAAPPLQQLASQHASPKPAYEALQPCLTGLAPPCDELPELPFLPELQLQDAALCMLPLGSPDDTLLELPEVHLSSQDMLTPPPD